MDKKPQKSWTDVQTTIAALAITVTLTLWNVFATPTRQQVSAQTTDAATPPPPPPTVEVAAAQPSPVPQFLPVKIIFGGPAPKQQVIVQAASAPVKKNNGGNSGGTPHTGTGSSKP